MVQFIERPKSSGQRLFEGFQAASEQFPDLINRLKKPGIENAENERIKELTGKDVSGLTPEMKKLYLEKYAKNPQHDQIKKSLIANGVPEEDADLYTMLTVGGQTQFAKDILEGKKRSHVSPENKSFSSPEEEIDDLEKMQKNQDVGLTPADRVKRESERFKTGLPVYQKTIEKLRSLRHTKNNLSIIEDLAKSDKLPKGLGRLNVDAEGNLKIPFLASTEAERFVKTINEFATGAKDTYGSRVTNFDLAQYLKQFPSLLNSKEGIKQLVEQLRIINDINSVYYKNLKDVFDKSGGTRKIDADIAEMLSEKKSEKEVSRLSKKFAEIGTEKSLPPAHKNKGERFQDEETGDIFISDGRNWVKEEK